MTVASGRLADFVVDRRMVVITALALPIGALSAGHVRWDDLLAARAHDLTEDTERTRHLIAFGRRPARPVY